MVIDFSAKESQSAECVGGLRQPRSLTEFAVKSPIGLPSEKVDGWVSSQSQRLQAAEVEEVILRSSQRPLVSSISLWMQSSVVKA